MARLNYNRIQECLELLHIYMTVHEQRGGRAEDEHPEKCPSTKTSTTTKIGETDTYTITIIMVVKSI